eukprot:gene28643-35537_t
MKANNVLATIGNTPHIRINRLFGDNSEVWIKSERSNPGGSIKDRIALAMVEAAEADGRLQPGGTIIEPTSGNTGVGLAMVAAVKGYKLVLVMPDSMSIERRRLMLAYGASFDLTPREKGMKGAIARAQELAAETPGAWIPQQFENPANIAVHVATTAQEILADFPEGLDALITGVGTGGHISGTAQVLKKAWPNLKVYAVEPSASPVISGGAPSPHPIQGIGAGFIPANLQTDLLDGVIQVDAEPAREYARRAAREEGLLVGISSGATLAAIAQKHNGCTGYGVELDDANVLACAQRGVNVLQLNLDQGLKVFADQSFDVVLQIDTLQHLRNAEVMLRETARVGKIGIVAFPNFAHWFNRLSVLRGRMPVTKRLPYQWYDTPNIRVGTYADFADLARKNDLRVLDAFGLQHGHEVRYLPNLMAGTAVFKLQRR